MFYHRMLGRFFHLYANAALTNKLRHRNAHMDVRSKHLGTVVISAGLLFLGLACKGCRIPDVASDVNPLHYI